MEFQGRTGAQRPKIHASIVYDKESNQYHIRVDDEANLEFWLQITIPSTTLHEAQVEKP